MNPLYAQTLLIGTTPVRVFPTVDGVNRDPRIGVRLRVPETYGGSTNTYTAKWGHSSAAASSGSDVAFGDAGTVFDTSIDETVLANGGEIWVVGSNANTPVSVIVE